MDEIQAFPLRYWHLFETFMPIFFSTLKSYFLMSSATFPGFFNKRPEPISESGVKLFNRMARSEIYYVERNITPDQIIDELIENHGLLDMDSVLIVSNTVASSQIIYQNAKQRLQDGWMHYYLSAAITPKDRQHRIQKIKHSLLERKHKIILVSTQVIEAGVDLSFQFGFRDMAPWIPSFKLRGESIGMANMEKVNLLSET